MSLTTEQISEVVEELEEIVREARAISGSLSHGLQDTRAAAYAYAIEGRARDALQILKGNDVERRASRDCW